MRPVRYNVAASLDGYIAGPNGEFDWIPEDPTVDFGALFAKVDTVLIGRRTWDVMHAQGGGAAWPRGSRVFVFSRTLRAAEHPGVTVVSEGAVERVAALRAEQGDGEIWLFGGGELFAELLAAGQVDAVEVTIVPVLLGGGVPLLPGGPTRVTLTLTRSHVYPSGMVGLHYAVRPPA
jgi:dihydrofolate reductase